MLGTVLSTKLKNAVSILVLARVCTEWRPSQGVVIDAVEDLWDLCPNQARQLLFQESFAFVTMTVCTLGDRVECRFLQTQ